MNLLLDPVLNYASYKTVKAYRYLTTSSKPLNNSQKQNISNIILILKGVGMPYSKYKRIFTG